MAIGMDKVTYAALLLLGCLALAACDKSSDVPDEALLACRQAPEMQKLDKKEVEQRCLSGWHLQQGSADDYLKDMDRGAGPEQVHENLAQALQIPRTKLAKSISTEELWKAYNRGRNNWVIWSGGNDRLWDYLSNNTYGAFDLLKTLSSHPSIKYCGNKRAIYGYKPDGRPDYYDNGSQPIYERGYYVYEDDECQGDEREFFLASRENRWKYFGLVNEPCFEQATGPDQNRYGLWLDKRIEGPGCPKDPFANEAKYPGVKFGARGDNGMPVGSFYGYPTGIVGLRLFPNPDFDEQAREAWDAERYYTDSDYYEQKDLVRPYRVGMSCGFCHVGPSPINPPEDPENPQWANLTSNPGAQYFWIDRIFFWNPKGRHENFIYQLFHTSLPGSLDTSLVSSDNINNPRTMNAVYDIAARLDMAKHAKEKLTGGELDNKQFNDYKRTEFLSAFFTPPDTVFAPHVLKDGADSVGVLGALNRVYINIGLYSEGWLRHFKPLIGSLPGKRITPITIEELEKNSVYWNANIAQTPDVALFFAASALPDRLKDFSKGRDLLKREGDKALQEAQIFDTHDEMLAKGKIVFARNCARCHSGKQPKLPTDKTKDYTGTLCVLGTRCRPGQIIENSAEYFEWMENKVTQSDFLEHNFLSSERRIPVTELGTNACSPLATNGLHDDIWDNFTSTTYKELPAVGKITVHHPTTGEPWEYEMPGGGRGYTRPASLISLWSTAPFLLNNSVGEFYGAASPEARMASFNDSIKKMLWPEERRTDERLGDTVPGYIQRTTTTSYLKVSGGYLPDKLERLQRFGHWIAPWLFDEAGIKIGPIPEGTPVGLLANLPFTSDTTRFKDKTKHFEAVVKLTKKAIHDLKELPEDATDEQARAVFENLVDPLLQLSKCPDYVVNRGHYFGTNLTDAEKWALIEFLRTF